MTVLITGGGGFIGWNLATRLAAEGTQVVVLDNYSSSTRKPEPRGVTIEEGDTTAHPYMPGGPFDTIYHLASVASPPRYLDDPIGTLMAGGEGTRYVLDRAETDGSVFVFASTSEIYGDPMVTPQPESYFGNVDVTSTRACYDEAKRYGEALVHAYRRQGRVPDTRVARIFNTYGPGMDPDDGRVITNMIMQGLAGQPLPIYGDGHQTRSFCYVDDLIEGLLDLEQSDLTLPCNLGSDTEITINQLADLMETFFGDNGRTYQPLPQSDPKRRRPELTRARTHLQWNPPTALEDGIAATIEHLSTLVPHGRGTPHGHSRS